MDGIIHEPITSQELCTAVSKEVEAYVGFSSQANMYLILDDTHQSYAVVIVPHKSNQLSAEIVVMARVVSR